MAGAWRGRCGWIRSATAPATSATSPCCWPPMLRPGAPADAPEAVVMDDGHQNPSVRKALSLVVVDGETRDGEWPFGDGAVVPAGPMREPLAAGLERARGGGG